VPPPSVEACTQVQLASTAHPIFAGVPVRAFTCLSLVSFWPEFPFWPPESIRIHWPSQFDTELIKVALSSKIDVAAFWISSMEVSWGAADGMDPLAAHAFRVTAKTVPLPQLRPWFARH